MHGKGLQTHNLAFIRQMHLIPNTQYMANVLYVSACVVLSNYIL